MGENLVYGIIGVIAILAGFGGSQLIDEDSLDHTYVCNITEQVGVFSRMSSTMKTGYYPDPANPALEKSKVCTNGKWIKLSDYAAMKGVDPMTFLVQEVELGATNNAPTEDCFPQDLEIGCIKRS
jgi:hypothetical protein